MPTALSGGFTGSALWRVLIAIGYTAVAFLLVLTIEHRTMPPMVIGPVHPVHIIGSAQLTLVPTYAVAHWTVQIAGKDIIPSAADAHQWRGPLTLTDRPGEVFVSAEAADALATTACALRAAIVVPGQPDRTQVLWGDGIISATLPVPAGAAGPGEQAAVAPEPEPEKAAR